MVVLRDGGMVVVRIGMDGAIEGWGGWWYLWCGEGLGGGGFDGLVEV